MKTGSLDRRLLALLASGILLIVVLRFGVYGDRAPQVVGATGSIPLAEKRLARLRQIAATVPGKEMLLRQARADLVSRERSMIQTQTAPQAQAQLLQTARRIGAVDGINIRGGDMGPVRMLGRDYGEVSVSVSFECRIEQLVNFLSALANEPDLLATSSVRVASGNPKEKSVSTRIELTGVVPRKLVPERKGLGYF